MRIIPVYPAIRLAVCLLVGGTGIATVSAAVKEAALNWEGIRLESSYAEQLRTSRLEIEKLLPKIGPSDQAVLAKARDAVKVAEAEASATERSLETIQSAKALVEHAKGKWIGGAEKGIAQAEAAMKKAGTEAEREAAKKDLTKYQADKEAGIKALKERQEALEKAKSDEPKVGKANQTAQAALAQARTNELVDAKGLLAKLENCLTSDRLDALLVKATVLAEATPRGLAGFAQQGKDREALADKLLADHALMSRMLEAGGAKFGKYGQAMEIYTTIQRAGAGSGDDALQRLALAVSLEHAQPIAQSNPRDKPEAPATVDPVKRYQHYEKAYLDGELDAAFKNLSACEYRMVVNCDAPDEILGWGREMLLNYRPDHILNPDYGWRYSSTVRTEVPYGSQNVKDDFPSLQDYQNIIKDGGVCGRRAFFGRFILRAFGIPTWGVTQHAHAALSHWTPQGWVINMGAGFEKSWWDKDEAPRSGTDFLLETQARAHAQDFRKVLRARWISKVLGEQAYNDRKGVAGGFWSSMAHYQTVVLAGTAVALGPLGQELAEANEPKQKASAAQVKVTEVDRQVITGPDGVITIPAAAFGKPSGSSIVMNGFPKGVQLHCLGGFKAEYVFETTRPGKYALTAQVATVQEGQKFSIEANDAMISPETAVPYTLGRWQQTQPMVIPLVQGKNLIRFALKDGSRGVTIRNFTLRPVD